MPTPSAPVVDETKLTVDVVANDTTHVTGEISKVVTKNTYNLSQFKTTKGFASGINSAIKSDQRKNVTAVEKSTKVEIYTATAQTFGRECIEIFRNSAVDVIYTFKHNGRLFRVTIPAGTDITKLLDKDGYAGPLWIGKEKGAYCDMFPFL